MKTEFNQLLSVLVIFGFLNHESLAEKSTIERIRKHQEWLQQRRQQKKISQMSNSPYKTSFDMPNLWRFPKAKNNSKVLDNVSFNEVFPENEKTSEIDRNNLLNKTLTKVIDTVTIETPSPTPLTTTDAPIIETTLSPILPTTSLKELTNSTETSQHAATTSNATAQSVTFLETTPADILESSTFQTATDTPVTKRQKPKLRPYPRWGNWSEWSECSRSCGVGVMYQQRKCINRNLSSGKRYISNICVGVYKHFRTCNEQPCPKADGQDFRAVQCATFNDIDFQGQKYNWESYTKDDAECELNCKPAGMKYFATLNSSVIDGTPCLRPAEFYRSSAYDRAVCVNGVCKAIHANGVINSVSANSGSVGCGGLLCRPITGIFTRDPLPEDAYVHVATIPAGASNISITELKNSINLLVLRTIDQKYVFNGDNTASESGAYETVGSIFDYHRIDGLQHGDGVTEWITCTGPIREMLELMIFSKAPNPGIKYEYLLPIISDSEENDLSLETDGFLKAGPEDGSTTSSVRVRRRKYNWKVVGFSACTKSCGGGTQTPVVRCVRDSPLRYYSQRRCMHSEKPVLNENLLRCNTQPCPAYWRIDDWGECRCQQGEGLKHREVNCVQELASAIVIHVDNSACMEEQPSTRKVCDCPKNRRRSHVRHRTNIANSTAHLHRNRDKAGVWLSSDWNQCSSECGVGVEYRTIFCDRTKQHPERCDSHIMPEITRPCQTERACLFGEWFAGPWSPCNGNCFNLTRTRQVLCIQNQLIVEDDDCRTELKPQIYEKCSHDEVEYCGPRWHYSDWSECTKTCDGGTQRRSVRCLEYNGKEGALRESPKCRYSLREPIYRSCNTQKCEDSSLDILQNDVAVSCVDEFSNCEWAVKAKLCSYEYYQQNCCYSCGAA